MPTQCSESGQHSLQYTTQYGASHLTICKNSTPVYQDHTALAIPICPKHITPYVSPASQYTKITKHWLHQTEQNTPIQKVGLQKCIQSDKLEPRQSLPVWLTSTRDYTKLEQVSTHTQIQNRVLRSHKEPSQHAASLPK